MAEPSDLTLSFLRLHPESAAEVLEGLESGTAAAYLSEVPPRLAAPVLAAMLPFYAAQCLEQADETACAGLLSAMRPTAAAGILRRMAVPRKDALLERLPARSAFGLRLLLRYPATTVGAWMEPGVVWLPAGITVLDAWMRLRREADALDRYVYLVDRDQMLVARVSTAEMLRADAEMLVDRLGIAVPGVIAARTDITAALGDTAWRECDPLPVVSREGSLLGVAHFAVLHYVESAAPETRQGSVFGETLMQLAEAYWTGVSRLIEGPFALFRPSRGAGPGKE